MVKPTLEAGALIDGFRLEELIHRGGMSELWRVTRRADDPPMLMKVPLIKEGSDPATIVGFEMEQMIMPRLTGPHVPKFVAAGDFAVQPYIVMERIAGQSLLPRLKELPLPYPEVAALGAKIATALDALHRQHVVHLDIKPSNIVLRPGGEAVLLDYGLSHHAQLPDLMQEEFRVPFGTAPYMSPEQLKGDRTDPRSDQFALGVLLYFFSTGVRPRDRLARESGLAIGERGGVVIGASCRTSDPAIWAIGECASFEGECTGLVAPGNAMADVVVDRLLGGPRLYTPAPEGTKLKGVGIDAASFGDVNALTPGALEVTFTDPVAKTYRKLVVSDDARTLLGGVFVGDAAPYAGLRPLLGSELSAEAAAYLSAAGAEPPVGDELPDAALVCACNNVAAGKKTLAESGLKLESADTMADAAQKIVKLVA